MLRKFSAAVLLLILAIPLCAQNRGSVTIYCSLDQEFSDELLDLFEQRTGIEVKRSFDIEQDKTVGMVNKIISEQSNPRCDVFWNNEVGQSVRLKNLGLLQPYISPNAATIPAGFKDAEGYWTGLAARARVIILNKTLMGDQARPSSIEDLLDPKWAGKITMARPLTGTTLTHAAALFAIWGEEKTKTFFKGLLDNGISWSQGNAMCMRSVGGGDHVWGYTDTDDANVALVKGLPTEVVIPDQGEGGLGTLLIPNSVMIVKGAQNLSQAQELVDFILSPEVEALLARGRSAQIPLHPGVPVPDGVLSLDHLQAMPVDWNEVGVMIERHQNWLKKTFEIGASPEGDDGKRTWPWVVGSLLVVAVLVVLGRKSAA